MSVARLRVVEEQTSDADFVAAIPTSPPPDAAASFTRVVSTPAAPPWRQRQAAELDARCGSPLPLGQVAYQLVRLDPWRAGQSARFAVTYNRVGPGRSGRRSAGSAIPDLLGALLPSSAAASDPARSSAALVILGYVVAILIFALAIVIAVERRTDIAGELAELQRRAAVAQRQAVTLATDKRQAHALLALGERDRSPEQVLRDMAWLSRHLAPNVSIQAFHWRRGVSAVEVASPDPPFVDADRHVQRASRSIRPGMWLWGVSSGSAASNDVGDRR